jgi:hypothetical protein
VTLPLVCVILTYVTLSDISCLIYSIPSVEKPVERRLAFASILYHLQVNQQAFFNDLEINKVITLLLYFLKFQ